MLNSHYEIIKKERKNFFITPENFEALKIAFPVTPYGEPNGNNFDVFMIDARYKRQPLGAYTGILLMIPKDKDWKNFDTIMISFHRAVSKRSGVDTLYIYANPIKNGLAANDEVRVLSMCWHRTNGSSSAHILLNAGDFDFISKHDTGGTGHRQDVYVLAGKKDVLPKFNKRYLSYRGAINIDKNYKIKDYIGVFHPRSNC